MKIEWALLAQAASVDRFSNRLSIFNLVENIEAPSFPLFLPEAVFVVLLKREEGEPAVSDGTLSIHAGESQLGQANVHIDFESSLYNRQIINFQIVPIFKPVNLQFRLTVPDQLSHVLEIPVKQSNPVQPVAAA